MPQTIFCDEAGFTGDHLLNRDQRFFSYAAVAIDAAEAQALTDQVIRDYRVSSPELKGRNLLPYAKGRRAIEFLIGKMAGRIQLVVHHKEYALATKFFEYVFEPLVSSSNSVFYAANFHKFIGSILYLNMYVRHERALLLSQRFERAVRADESELEAMFSIHGIRDEDPIEQLISFGVYNRDAILRELREVKAFGGWILELTLTSVWSLLTHWGDKFDSLDVVCDSSLPLQKQQDFINMMVGRTDKATVRFGQRERSMLFNLTKPLSYADSRVTPGIQLADVFAAVACAVFEDAPDTWRRDVFRELFQAGAIHGDCVLPDIAHVDLRLREPSVNYCLLLELVQRSREGRSLTEGIGEFLIAAHSTFPEFERRHLRYDISGLPELSRFRSNSN